MSNDPDNSPEASPADTQAGATSFLSPEELSRIYASYWPYLLAIARSRVGNNIRLGETASDIVQRAFLAAHKNAQQGRLPAADGNALKSYLAQIVRNLDIDADRKTKARVHGGGMIGTGEVEFLANDTTSPSGKAAREEQRVRVAAALTRLEPDHARILIWRHYEELTFAQIASRAGYSESNAKKAYNRAAAALRVVCGDDGPREEADT